MELIVFIHGNKKPWNNKYGKSRYNNESIGSITNFAIKLSDDFKLMCADALAPIFTTTEATPSAHKPQFVFQAFVKKNVTTIHCK